MDKITNNIAPHELVNKVNETIDNVNAKTVSTSLTKAAYDALSTSEKNNGTIYYVTDEDEVGTTVVQTTGTSTINVMSQNATTDAINTAAADRVAINQGSGNASRIMCINPSGSLEVFAHDQGPGFHNSIYRGKYLGTAISTEHNNAIKNRTYDDMFLGDYWTINGMNYRIAAFDYYYAVGDTGFGKGNIIVVPDSYFTYAVMNDTNTTSGGYAGSKMRSSSGGLATARTAVASAFGSHVASHRVIMTNATDSNGPTGWAWMDSDGIELMSEMQVYGAPAWSSGIAKHGYDVGTQMKQFPLFAVAPQWIHSRNYWYWLQDISADWPSGHFCVVGTLGNAAANGASDSGGVRPAITLSYI